MINFASKKFRDDMMKTCLKFTQDIKNTLYEVKIIGFVFGFIEGQKADLKKSDSFSIELQGKIQYDLYLFNYIIIKLHFDGKRGFGDCSSWRLYLSLKDYTLALLYRNILT